MQTNVDQFFDDLAQLGNDIEQSVNAIQTQLVSRRFTEDQFIPHATTRINILDAQANRMKKCLFSQKSTTTKTNLSLQYILSICQIILDENEILMDDIEDKMSAKVALSRETLYDSALQIYREQESKQELSIEVPVNDIRTSISRLPPNTLPVLSTPVKQRSTMNDPLRTPLRTPIRTSIPNDNIRESFGQRTTLIVPNEPQRISLTKQTVPVNDTGSNIVEIPLVEQKELDTLPSYLVHQIPSLDALNDCVKIVRTLGNGVTQSNLRYSLSNYTEDKYLRAFLLVLLKLKRFSRTSRDTVTNELTYYKQ
jgi:type II secretory pathway pseudopilin PulG